MGLYDLESSKIERRQEELLSKKESWVVRKRKTEEQK